MWYFLKIPKTVIEQLDPYIDKIKFRSRVQLVSVIIVDWVSGQRAESAKTKWNEWSVTTNKKTEKGE